MTPAAFSSSKPCSCGWTAQMLSRMLPPTPTSVVAEASSSCSPTTSAMNSWRAGVCPWRTTQATWRWCMARIIPLDEQALAISVTLAPASASEAPMPPNSTGISVPSRPADWSASKVSKGKRDRVSTSSAAAAVTSAAIEAAREATSDPWSCVALIPGLQSC